MSDPNEQALSQADIDAMMQGTDSPDPAPTPAAQPAAGAPAAPAADKVEIADFAFGALDKPKNIAGDANKLDLIIDIKIQISVEIGRTSMTIKDLLQLVPGSVIELDKLAGDPLDIFVNDSLVAKGKVVVVDENFGIRITDLVSPEERIKSLHR